MGQRKKLAADARKEAMRTVAVAHLRNVPTSPRRMRQVADLIDRVISAPDDAASISAVASEVHALTARFPIHR